MPYQHPWPILLQGVDQGTKCQRSRRALRHHSLLARNQHSPCFPAHNLREFANRSDLLVRPFHSLFGIEDTVLEVLDLFCFVLPRYS